MSRSERATSVALGYVLTLSITTILVSGLFITAGSVVDGQRQQATTQELTVHGERLAADLATVDRLARTGSTVELERELPAAVVGATYRIGIDGERLVLRSERADGSVTVSFVAERDVEIAGGDSLGGGPVVIAFEDETIEVRDG